MFGAVEVAGRFVGEHDERFVAQSARAIRDPLPFTAGKRRGQETRVIGQSDLLGIDRGIPGAPRVASARRAVPRVSTLSLAVSSSIRWQAGHEADAARRGPLPGPAPPTGRFDARAIQTSPSETRSRPPSRCNSEDFPQPLGPIIREHLAAVLEVDAVDGAHQSFSVADAASACAAKHRHVGVVVTVTTYRYGLLPRRQLRSTYTDTPAPAVYRPPAGAGRPLLLCARRLLPVRRVASFPATEDPPGTSPCGPGGSLFAPRQPFAAASRIHWKIDPEGVQWSGTDSPPEGHP